MRFALAFGLIVGAAPAFAEGLQGTFFSSGGRLSFGFSDRAQGADAFAVADASARVGYKRVSAELGFFGRGDALDTPHETYGALGLSLSEAETLSIGVPRPAYDAFAVSRLELEFPSLSIDRVAQTRSAATSGAMFLGWLPFGATYQRQHEGFDYALSFHRAEGQSQPILGLGIGTQTGPWTLSGAVESAPAGMSLKAQAVRDMGRWSGGVTYYAPAGAGLSDLVEFYADIRVHSRVRVTAIIQTPVYGSAGSGGLAGHYALTEDLMLNVGVGSDSGSRTFFSTGLSYGF